MTPSTGFYASIPSFDDFREITLARNYRPAPAHWWVVLTDVKGSTRAIEEGRYKDVNRIGAAAIACAQKALGGADFPYAFGGDGATLLVPSEQLENVTRSLAALKGHAERRFGLSLRVGAVPVGEAQAHGAKIEVGRFRLSAGRCIAVFRGGGLTRAEALIKSDERRYGLAAEDGPAPDLDDLSCRWNAIPARLGVALSVLVQARGPRPQHVYGRVLRGIERVLRRGLRSANPVQLPAMRYRGWWACVLDERRQFPTAFSLAFCKKLLGITVSVLSLRWGLRPGFYDPVAYKRSIPAHSDYCKFDDTLRMVLDCSPEQAARLEAYLDGLRKKGLVYYGLHASPSALITCYVHSTDPGGHIHFVDGSHGGYAMAAKSMKTQRGPR